MSAGMAIYDAMQFVPCDVATVCFGMAASMGAFLLGAGAPVRDPPALSCMTYMADVLGGVGMNRPCMVPVVLCVQGKRRSLPNARIMIHQPLGGAQGQAADIEIQVGEAAALGMGSLADTRQQNCEGAWRSLFVDTCPVLVVRW